MDDTAIYREAFRAGLTPDPDLTVSQWADEFRMLSQKASAEPGRWRTDRTPYLREIHDSLSPSDPTQRVVFMAGAQVGKTETGNNWTGFVIHMAPGPMMLVQPTVDMAKRLSKQRLAPMIEESPVLRERIAESRARDSGNTMMTKEFPGGFMLITGANSAVGLRSMPVRYLFLDEIDGFPVDLDGEGDPVNLAERRTTTFARRKIFMSSTPTVKDTSRIEREYLASDQRRFHIPCPHCGEFQSLKWANIKWDDGDPATAHYVCEHSGCIIEEYSKTEFLLRGEWRPTARGDGRTRGYHLSSLYSPLGWKSWSEIVDEFLRAKGDPPLLKTFVNTILAETWEDEIAAKIGAGELMDRVEFYPSKVAPAGVLAITAGIDTQDNRLAITLTGWGRDEESWVLDHQEIFGDPAKPEVWAQLKDLLTRPVEHELFEALPISASCIDSGGHFTHEVYAFAREHRALHVMAVKGQSQKNKPIIGRPTKVDLNLKRQTIKNGAEVWPVGTDTAKQTIYSRLKLADPGAGFTHFHANLPPDYFAQLTAEKLVTRYVKGFPVREWTKKAGARNEALDTFVYALAAMQSLYMRFNRRSIWDQFEAKMTPKVKEPAKQVVLPRERRSGRLSQPKSFVSDW
jgi:phage terminase large subunit GpA-like protein